MFFAGGTFGVESEARDANKRPSGRRHQARDMAELQATVDASQGVQPVPAEGTRCAAAQRQMATGPSFLDRMYEHNSAVVESAHPAGRRVSAPTDHLNIFSWDDTAPASRPPIQSRQVAASGSRATQPVNTTGPVPTVEDRRAAEARKFETSSESAFLRFTDAPKAQPRAEAGNRDARTGAVSGKPATSLPPCGDMMGNLMREQPPKPRGRRGPAVTPTSNRSSVPEESGVAGFPGMGQRSIPRGPPHLTRKPAQSNVFPSPIPNFMQQEDFGQREDARAPPAPKPGPKAKCTPPYYIDDDDYENHRPTNAYETEAYSQQPCQQEIRMYDENEYDNHDQAHAGDFDADAQRRAQGAPNLEWLYDSKVGGGAGGFPAKSPSEQRCQYQFDAEKQQFYEADAPPSLQPQHN
ncbi:conserved hypothetical protein [Leishmania mexicana MHOM/GT/2001/U1103]|uniref:Uncharacterized protein n=1 Tax=Leishmania mexicana (strain MHOM/GT/2001/U1103) TaxID=929439 RepID=E9AZS3_LEIMU|nr:conserved hypothetical protein [Leishmania mexicana MHOM/GT/2001/U1103]CBZ28474.1 conserved hypothetical protein [Leishmania mexicana MHOM/GT/2001/U1103]